METEQNGEKIKAFLKENILVVLLFSLGLILLVYGVIVFLGQSKAQVEFQEGSTQARQPDVKHEEIKVDIEGAVLRPGVYTLAKESRIQDLFIKAGGVSADADRQYVSKNINLAQKLSDGGKIYIPKTSDVSQNQTDRSSYSESGKINVNSASIDQLDTLAGVGKATAQKIIDGRPYTSLDELLSKKVVGQSVFDKIKEKITVY